MSGQEVPVSSEIPNYDWEDRGFSQDFPSQNLFSQETYGLDFLGQGFLSQDVEDLSGQGVTDADILGQDIVEQYISSLNVFNSNGLHPDFLGPIDLYPDGYNLETDQNPLDLEHLNASNFHHACYSNIVGPDAVDERDPSERVATQNVNPLFNLNQLIPHRYTPDQYFNGTVSLDNTNLNSSTASPRRPQVLDDSEPRCARDGFPDKPNGTKKGKSRISDEEWEDHKEIIRQIWIVENHTLPELTRIMTRDYKFPAT